RATEQRIVCGATEKVGVVVVECEHPAELLSGFRRVGSDRHGAVPRLKCPGDAVAATSGEQALSHPPRRIADEPGGELERVRTPRTHDDFGHVREPTASSGHGCTSVLRRVNMRPTVERS